MRVFKHHKDLCAYLELQRGTNSLIAFVPTMGALHPGHLSLIRAARQEGTLCVVSIFVNPTQFNDPADFEAYPKTLDADLRLLEAAHCDVLYLPDALDIYPDGPVQTVSVDLQGLDQRLEGAHRPGHFQGVVQVMDRLLGLVQPNLLFMGLKDYQQVLVVRRLLDTRRWPMNLKGMETCREADGLAMSSRNLRLSGEARQLAPKLYQTLQEVAAGIRAEPSKLADWLKQGRQQLQHAGFSVEYLEAADGKTLEPIQAPIPPDARLLVAAWLEQVRLIDNIGLAATDPIPS